MINLDSTKAFIRDDRRVEQIFCWYVEVKDNDRRKTPHSYSDTKELCLLVEGVPDCWKYMGDLMHDRHHIWSNGPHNWAAKPPLKLNDVACLAEPWGRVFSSNPDYDAPPVKASDISGPLADYIEIQPFSTMPPHLGKCVQIMGEPRVELIAPNTPISKKAYHFIYPIKEVESDNL